MAQRVVDVAEAVDVQHEDGKLAVAILLVDHALDHLVDRGPVEQPCQAVEIGKVGNVFLRCILLERQRAEGDAGIDNALRPCVAALVFTRI
ncbi:hypothetical protein GLUCOINTEAF2_0202181 [Komagataeibacter intermedius AF2]|uniref:Uncharacterized protein n=1 Tax=Komagataeibacter intermedius AF2 TaxID=1458464 RepID=A0A0N0MFZ4_9PROT|nr:hypothetical protein GLUCOINTEAF2_0202181 [Komagataeibacter intermedius AF2]